MFFLIDPVVLFVQEKSETYFIEHVLVGLCVPSAMPREGENEENAWIDVPKVMEVTTGYELPLVLAVRSKQYLVCPASSTF